MHTMIIAKNLKQAEFIRKGLYYESLSSDILQFGRDEIPESNIYAVDGVFILLDNRADIESALDFCLGKKPSLPIMLLAQQYDIFYDELLKGNRIQLYFVRPFPFRQMSAEMRFAIFRMKETSEVRKYTVRDLELNLTNHQVLMKNKAISLRNREFSLLHYLMLNKGKVLTRTEILENVWDRNINILTNTVDVHISQLRKKIGNGNDCDYIHTVPCTGYIFE